jgi:hypothetical protein
MSLYNKLSISTATLRHPSSVWLGVAAAASLLLGCVSGTMDALPDDLEEDVATAESEVEVLAAGDPVFIAATTGTAQNGTPSIRVPNGTAAGDLLLLFLHRTDDTNFWDGPTQLQPRLSPWRSGGWQGPVATCAFDNSAGDFDCRGTENDLNQVLYWKKATTDDLRKDGTQYERLTINFPGSHPAWAIMATIRNGGSSSNPVRAWKGQTACDKIAGTRFPSVSGNAGDMLLLSQSFDDGESSGITSSSFTANSGFTRRAQVIDNDEAGHLYSRLLTTTGSTPAYETNGGAGSPSTCKDIAVSIVIRKSGT